MANPKAKSIIASNNSAMLSSAVHRRLDWDDGWRALRHQNSTWPNQPARFSGHREGASNKDARAAKFDDFNAKQKSQTLPSHRRLLKNTVCTTNT
jgi:hypothetical protein